MLSAAFHPAVERWFTSAFGAPTEPQARGWPAIAEGRDCLIAAPTGSGKTLAAFLCAIDGLIKRGVEPEGLPDTVQVVYVSPLKALGNDIERNLRWPLEGIERELRSSVQDPPVIRVAVRSGDTPARERVQMGRRPPHIFVTTPESLFILLTSEGGRRLLRSTRTLILDEVHALIGSKRGAHLALSVERLEALIEHPLQRIGLSATQRPIARVAEFLVGAGRVAPDVVDAGHLRELDLCIEVPPSPLEGVMSAEVHEELYDRLAKLVHEHRTTLVFVNTRRMAERVAGALAKRIGQEAVTSHHGSLAREHRLLAERRLKSGDLRALVATASLELGIDVGEISLVCQLGSPRSVSALLQRVGRSGHFKGGIPKGRLFPLSRDELAECTALLRCVRDGELDVLRMPVEPLDILAQQLVAAVAAEPWELGQLFALVRRAAPYARLPREKFDQVVHMLADGFVTRAGRRRAYVHLDAVQGRVKPRRGARLAAITSGGAIADNADYEVVLDPSGTRVGTVNEDFAIESMQGDIFQLGNASYRILKVERGKVRVEDARGQPPTLPFWLGEAPARTDEVSNAVSRLRTEVEPHLESSTQAAANFLERHHGLPRPAAEQLAEYMHAGRNALGAMPSKATLVAERFFDEAGAMHVVVHAPLGSRLNRAWGLALRKSFCRRFNVELQAAATDDAIILSLGPTHSFPLQDVFGFLRSATAGDVLCQAVLDAPLFTTRWRWNAGRALAVLRFRGGKKVHPPIQRMEADDLLSLVFPDQVACLENIQGAREIPDHPLVEETLKDCLHDAMDADGLRKLIADIEAGERTCLARDLTEPSPFAAEILGARPYAFLDDAPLEERRAQAVASRRWLDPATAADLGALDRAAIDRVAREAMPDVTGPEELHDLLLWRGGLTTAEGERRGWAAFFEPLVQQNRAGLATIGARTLWIAAERVALWRVAAQGLRVSPELPTPAISMRGLPQTREEALAELVRGSLECLAVVTAEELSDRLGLQLQDAQVALARLEGEGFVLRGRFEPGNHAEQWCERRLLARIHRLTLDRLRREIEPVNQTDFVRFLFEWQRAAPGARVEGLQGLASVLEQLSGFEAAASAWEPDLLSLRVEGYDPQWLDTLCLSGRFGWLPRARGHGASAAARVTPLTFATRSELSLWSGLRPAQQDSAAQLSHRAERILAFLSNAKAAFFSDILAGTGLLRSEVEHGLGELVASGRVTADGFGAVRALLARPKSRKRHSSSDIELGGRWALLEAADVSFDAPEQVARTLLRRWGVTFRRILDRERLTCPWRDLVRVFRTLEARGQVRGGRFVEGVGGEQFALPEAVTLLRQVRRSPKRDELISVSGADPMNLVGYVIAGPRLPSLRNNRVLYCDGRPLAVRMGKTTQWLETPPEPEQWARKRALASSKFRA